MKRSVDLLQRSVRGGAMRLSRLGAAAEARAIDREIASICGRHVRDIHTWTKPAELRALFTLASQAPSGATLVELGSYLGASTCHLAAGAARAGARLIAVDLWNNETIVGDARDIFAEFQQNVAPLAEHITVVRKRTQELSTADVRPPIHLAFIDADHSYEATRSDAEFLGPLIAPDGLLVFHDATTFAGVGKVFAELLLSGEWALGGRVENLAWMQRAKWSAWPPVAPESNP